MLAHLQTTEGGAEVPDGMTLETLQDAHGLPVLAADGDAIGKVEEVFYDDQTGRPEWIGIGTGFFGTKRVLVPVARAELHGDALRVPFDKDHVKDSPDVDSDEISQDAERELYAYYGLAYSERRSESGLPASGLDSGLGDGAADTPGDVSAGEPALTRSEEELSVSKERVAAGTARLRKWVETEPVEIDVTLRQEAARVYREPVDEPVSAAEIGEEEVELELHAEQPVVEKHAVAKERVGLTKEVESEQERVTDELRKERVTVEGDDRP